MGCYKMESLPLAPRKWPDKKENDINTQKNAIITLYHSFDGLTLNTYYYLIMT